MGIGELLDVIRAEKERRIREVRALEMAEVVAVEALRRMTQDPKTARALELRARAFLLRTLARVGREEQTRDEAKTGA